MLLSLFKINKGSETHFAIPCSRKIGTFATGCLVCCFKTAKLRVCPQMNSRPVH